MAHEILRRPSGEVRDELEQGKGQPVTRPAAIGLLMLGLLMGMALGFVVFVLPLAR